MFKWIWKAIYHIGFKMVEDGIWIRDRFAEEQDLNLRAHLMKQSMCDIRWGGYLMRWAKAKM